MISDCRKTVLLSVCYFYSVVPLDSFTLSQRKRDVLERALLHNILIRKFKNLLIVHSSHV